MGTYIKTSLPSDFITVHLSSIPAK